MTVAAAIFEKTERALFEVGDSASLALCLRNTLMGQRLEANPLLSIMLAEIAEVAELQRVS